MNKHCLPTKQYDKEDCVNVHHEFSKLSAGKIAMLKSFTKEW